MNTNRGRTSALRANCSICWISSLPGVSAGWALPANLNCTGRSASVSSEIRRSGCDSSSVARLYVANRRANPMVSVSGLSTPPPSRLRTNRTRPRRPATRVSHTSAR